MIIIFLNDIIKEEGLEIPARITWMDGLKGVDSVEGSEKQTWIESSFLLMCPPCAKNKELQYLHEYLLESIAKILSKSWKWNQGQTKNVSV